MDLGNMQSAGGDFRSESMKIYAHFSIKVWEILVRPLDFLELE
jgi:hypothetical protein